MGNARNVAFWVILFLLILALFNLFSGGQSQMNERSVAYSDFMQQVESGQVVSATLDGERVQFTTGDGAFATVAPSDANTTEALLANGVRIEATPQEQSGFLSVLSLWLPVLVLIGIWIFFMNRMQGGGRGGAMGFGKSKAKMLTEQHGRVLFEDVAGVDEAKEDLQEIVDFLKDPSRFQKLGGKIPRGVLLVGPPGTGKTLLARAIAGEANVPFFTISGSDFVEMFVGVGASRVRDMFEQLKKNAPCIIFIDEIDAVGRHRGAGLGGGNDEREQTLNQLLVEMDGFEANEGIILIAATNRPDVLDPALLRPGRFDRQIVVPNPDLVGREKILKVHVRKVPLAPDVDLKTLARGTPGFAGADLANLVNEAALLAARRNKRLVTHQEFEDAKDKVMMGAERRTLVMTEDEKKLTAYHEAGHALVALHMPASDPIHKATIIPRGRALGMVMRLPERDQISLTRAKCKADLAVAMGGRVAEELIFGHEKVTSGASADIKMATKLSRAMATQFGMSDELGPLLYGENEEEVFLGHSVARSQHVSERTQELVDREVKRFVNEGYETAQAIIKSNLDDLHTIAKGLLEFETLTGEEIRDLLKGKAPVRETGSDEPAPRASTVPTTGASRRRPSAGEGGLEPQPQG